MAEEKWVVFDVEGDGLEPTKIYCLSFKDYDGKTSTLVSEEDIRSFFFQYDIYVGHNIRRWDLPHLERVVGIKIPERVIDTLGLAWVLDPGRKRAGLDEYGEEYGTPKVKISDWASLRLEEYIRRCEQDVIINERLFRNQLKILNRLYPKGSDLQRYLRYLDFKLRSAQLAESSRWKLDVARAQQVRDRLRKEEGEKLNELSRVMPRQEVTRIYDRPQKYYNSDGQPSLLALKWQERLKRLGLPEGHEEPVEEVVDTVAGNPSSHIQLKAWLYSLGWVPETIKHIRDKKTGKTKDIPQISKEHGGGICDSIKKLYDKEPNLELLDGLSIISHRASILDGFLRDVSEDGYLKASVAGLTNTLRFKHAEIVNLPKPEKPYGTDIRGCLVADDDYELCGSDMASLEDRIKQHFIYFHDPDYVAQLCSDDYDPHLDLAFLAGVVSEQQVRDYKAGLKSTTAIVKPIRAIYKNGNYACQYGAGIPRLVVTCGCDLPTARKIHETYWKRNWAIKAIAAEQEIKSIDGQMWLLNPINGFYYSLRYEKDIFSTLVQGTAAYCFDLYLGFVLQKRPQVTGQFHDEFILEVRKGHRDEVKELLNWAIGRVNEVLKLNRELGVGIDFGPDYSTIH